MCQEQQITKGPGVNLILLIGSSQRESCRRDPSDHRSDQRYQYLIKTFDQTPAHVHGDRAVRG